MTSEPFYSNYDLYDTEGVSGKGKQGPGTGLYSNLDKYKSVSEFRATKSKTRKKMLKKLLKKSAELKYAIDFSSDTDLAQGEILGDSGSVADSNLAGNGLDDYTQSTDENGFEPSDLEYGNNLDESEPNSKEYAELSPAEPTLMQNSEGFSTEDLDADKFINDGSRYGITDSGNTSASAGY